MAQSPGSRRHAHLLRQMSRDLNRPSGSVASSTGSNRGSITDSSVSNFDPDNDALMSTRQLDDISQRLPELRASAKKYIRRTRPEPDFVIDTSALKKAFPDFSQGGSSSDEGSLSIELSRGFRKSDMAAGNRDARFNDFANDASSLKDDSVLSSKFMVGNYEVMATPPMRQHHASRKKHESRSGQLKTNPPNPNSPVARKDHVQHSPAPAKTADYVSGSSRQSSGASRRTLSQMHARVRDEDDESFVSDDRPVTTTLTSKSTRFGGPKSNQPAASHISIPTKFSSTQKLAQEVSQKGDAAITPQRSGVVNGNNTQQSFMLPELPNLSELVSGVYQDGTPVFSRGGKSRSRFASAALSHHKTSDDHDRAQFESIPLPADEQAIFISLKLLQDRVAELENDKASTEQKIEELAMENETLKAESKARKNREGHRRTDSALGMADSGSDADEDMARRNDKLVSQNSKLESAMKSLQDRLDTANRKISVSEISVKKLTQDRDAAVGQLGVAYISSEEQKGENQALRAENDQLRSHIRRLTVERDDETHRWSKKEAALRRKVERRDEAVKEVREMTREIWEMRQAEKGRPAGVRFTKDEENMFDLSDRPTLGKSIGKSDLHAFGKTSQNRNAKQTKEEVTGPEKATKVQAASNDTLNASKNNALEPILGLHSGRSQSRAQQGPSTSLGTNNVDRQVARHERSSCRGLTDESFNNDESFNEPNKDATDRSLRPLRPRSTGPDTEVAEPTATDQLTDSFLDGDEIARLRKTLEEERAAYQTRLAAASSFAPVDDTLRSTRSQVGTGAGKGQNLPRKSSLKDVTGKPEIDDAQWQDDEFTGRFSVKAGEYTSQPTEKDESQVDASIAIPAHQRRRSEPSALGKTRTKSRRRASVAEMTSAFIVPDITIRADNKRGGDQPVLSASAKRVLNGLVSHDGQNCTVCRRVTSHDDKGSNGNPVADSGKKVLKVPKPVPASQRVTKSEPYEDEPTLRPSQPPALALATVLKGLEDELSHLRLELSQHQALYNSQDASIGKRSRKALHMKIQTLLKAIDVKADQIYALYDVLEGQRSDGHEITDEEFEITLNSIGINVDETGQVDCTSTSKRSHQGEGTRRPGPESEESSDEELPWEGIEDTINTSKSGRRGSVHRPSLAF
ncbi:MAG: hypothetical protein M1837_000769 [Sclerophora amabilis]|nr:MAG: hypothetical protein M1837_000769 [Sclerophora amabilis]